MDMALFMDRALTGGMSMIGKHDAYANNPYMKDYSQSIPKSYIMNFDCTNQVFLSLTRIKIKKQHFSMDGPCRNIFLLVDSNG